VGHENSKECGANDPQHRTKAVEFFGVGVDGVGAEEDGEVANKVADDERDERDARGGDDRLLADGGEKPKPAGAGGTRGFGRG
jgi:hypothetical protein